MIRAPLPVSGPQLGIAKISKFRGKTFASAVRRLPRSPPAFRSLAAGGPLQPIFSALSAVSASFTFRIEAWWLTCGASSLLIVYRGQCHDRRVLAGELLTLPRTARSVGDALYGRQPAELGGAQRASAAPAPCDRFAALAHPLHLEVGCVTMEPSLCALRPRPHSVYWSVLLGWRVLLPAPLHRSLVFRATTRHGRAIAIVKSELLR